MTRKLTITCELPEELCQAFEQKAAAEGRSVDEVVADQLVGQDGLRRAMNAEDSLTAQEAFERHLGSWNSGDPMSSANGRIDADLAREYAGG